MISAVLQGPPPRMKAKTAPNAFAAAAPEKEATEAVLGPPPKRFPPGPLRDPPPKEDGSPPSVSPRKELAVEPDEEPPPPLEPRSEAVPLESPPSPPPVAMPPTDPLPPPPVVEPAVESALSVTRFTWFVTPPAVEPAFESVWCVTCPAVPPPVEPVPPTVLVTVLTGAGAGGADFAGAGAGAGAGTTELRVLVPCCTVPVAPERTCCVVPGSRSANALPAEARKALAASTKTAAILATGCDILVVRVPRTSVHETSNEIQARNL
jgi:hypothetical protein